MINQPALVAAERSLAIHRGIAVAVSLLGFTVFSGVLGCEARNGQRSDEGAGRAEKHVQLVHLDGFRPDMVQSMLAAGQLPYLQFLGTRGKTSFRGSTVDKSETMKVIQSYLTSRVDTDVVGWWQFHRADFRFRNYWMDPGEVLNFALGVDVPRQPTILDFLAHRGDNLVSGMNLARRGVPFDNYARAYVEGLDAVSNQTYLEQADVTMSRFLTIHRRIAERDERSPSLSTILLAAADEYSHHFGVLANDQSSEYCLDRPAGTVDQSEGGLIFRLIDEDDDPALRPYGGGVRALESRYFTRTERSSSVLAADRVSRVCYSLPMLPDAEGDSQAFAEPRYVLAAMVLDMQLGYMIEAFRSIRFRSDGSRFIERPPLVHSTRPAERTPEDSLFSSTLFLVFADHGMVDTPHGMSRMYDNDSDLAREFIDDLNDKMGLVTPSATLPLQSDSKLGIEFSMLPARLRAPELDFDWQSESIQQLTRQADQWARAFFDELRTTVRAGLHEDYWWLFFLRSILIDPKLDGALSPVSEQAVAVLRRLYLRGIPEYLAAEVEANSAFYDRHVRLVYGGGARNNAELFIPACDERGCRWDSRPSYDQIVGYRPGGPDSPTLVDTLWENPGVGLIFVRRQNQLVRLDSALPLQMEIDVLDRHHRLGRIAVSAPEGVLHFRYRTLGESGDPLGYDRLGAGLGTEGSYREWIDWSTDDGAPYVGAVAGMGSYLYSRNSSIGDVVVMHQTGWNFGSNRGGHGGLHRDEKLIFFLASGPELGGGELFARSKGGQNRFYPSVLDLVPTALSYLGHDIDELDRFGAVDFEAFVRSWLASQPTEIVSRLDVFDTADRALDRAGVERVSWERLRPFVERLLRFVEVDKDAWQRRRNDRSRLGLELDLNSRDE